MFTCARVLVFCQATVLRRYDQSEWVLLLSIKLSWRVVLLPFDRDHVVLLSGLRSVDNSLPYSFERVHRSQLVPSGGGLTILEATHLHL